MPAGLVKGADAEAVAKWLATQNNCFLKLAGWRAASF